MRWNPKNSFIACLAIGLSPVPIGRLLPSNGAGFDAPLVHFAVALAAILVYGETVRAELSSPEKRPDETGTELSDSVYFLGFLQTMGVLGGAFLFASGAGDNRLLESVGFGVALTLVGLAYRVVLTLSSGASARSGRAAEFESIPSQAPLSAAGTQMGSILSGEQMDDVAASVRRLDEATKQMALQVKSMAKASQQTIETLDSRISEMHGEAVRWLGAINEIDQHVGQATSNLSNTVTQSLERVGKTFETSAERFESEVAQSHAALHGAVQKTIALQQQFDQVIKGSLDASSHATNRIHQLSQRQLTDLAAVADRIAVLSEEVRQRTESIPNPADVLVVGLQQLSATTLATTHALHLAGKAAGDSAADFQRIIVASQAVSPALNTLGPTVREGAESLRGAIREEAEQLREEIRQIDLLLTEFASLIRNRVSGIRK